MQDFPAIADRSEENEKKEPIVLEMSFPRKRKRVLSMLLCIAVLATAIAVGYALAGSETAQNGGGLPTLAQTEETVSETEQETESAVETQCGADTSFTEESGDDPSEEVPPAPGTRTPILSMDLSCAEKGSAYINNESIQSPDLNALLAQSVSSPVSEGPTVLILHTHTSEAYRKECEESIVGELGSETYSEDGTRNVIAAGKALSETLRKNGISTIHCTTVHDRGGMRGAYEASMESIRFFLTLYPTIRYVIDVQRDAVLNTEGEYVRTVTQTSLGDTAQIMAVVGSNGNGTAFEGWEGNLALALQLRALLNENGARVSRPVTLRNASYNQELSPYSLILEIGTGANSVAEAERAATLAGEALARLIYG